MKKTTILSLNMIEIVKTTALVSLLITCTSTTYGQTSKYSSIPDSSKQILTVEASCGQCQLGMKGSDCTLAVRIDGKSYFVKGADIDDFGDAHAQDGFCSAIRKAEVQGKIVGNKFKVTYFKLIE